MGDLPRDAEKVEWSFDARKGTRSSKHSCSCDICYTLISPLAVYVEMNWSLSGFVLHGLAIRLIDGLIRWLTRGCQLYYIVTLIE